ncbi:hypothetical protein C2E23DRAFT_613341 [Lenzites betulinus]|nr:hypothetical protein C2E23DRAFT_613341 [Lenzites betulinus]
MLLQWVDELPAHLRWRPDMPDVPFRSQAATLLATYHLLQALIQRPFIFPSLTLTSHHTRLNPYSPTAASEKALAVCLSASRASVAVVHTELRAGRGDVVTFLHVLFDSTGLLLTQLWGLVGRWAERGAAGSADRGEDDIDVARRISALFDEISATISHMQELAPKWELARIMLDDIQRALPTRFANLTVESTNNEALVAAQWATITRPAGMPAATLPYTPALPSAASSFGRAGFSMMDQPGQFDIAPFQEAGQSAAAVADRPLREDTFLPGHPPPLPHAWGSDRLWTAHAHNISARAGDGRLTRADEVQWSSHHLLGPPPIVGDTFPALSLPADTSAIGGALNAHSQYE